MPNNKQFPVYASLLGGVGNQLFNALAAYSFSRKYGCPFFLSTQDFGCIQGHHPKHYSYTVYKNFEFGEYETPVVIDEDEARNIFTAITKLHLDKLAGGNKSIVFSGYFQDPMFSHIYSFEYFQEFADLVSQGLQKYDMPDKYVAVHIRRGDYLRHRQHFVCDTDYYLRAMNMFPEHEFIIFTDDVEYVSKEFDGYGITIMDTDGDIDALSKMSSFKNIIISNSTFSWWASKLNGKADKIISPDRWFSVDFQNGYSNLLKDPDLTLIKASIK